MNRAIARRTAFETRADVRYFLAQLARAVRAGRVEVHAFCVLTTHFHLLVRSPRGEMGEAMRRVQNAYVRWFNRSRRRDGPLFRGRYRSRAVTSESYRRTLVRYIDFNPVEARLAATPESHAYGSARHYARSTGPPWLARDWVEATVREADGAARYEARAYAQVFGERPSGEARCLIERRIERRTRADSEEGELLSQAPSSVRDWMRRKSILADGTSIGAVVCDTGVIANAVCAARRREGAWLLGAHTPRFDAWLQIEVALRRELAGETFTEIARGLGCSQSAAWKMHARHGELLGADPAYAARVAEIAYRVRYDSSDHTARLVVP